MIKLQLVGDTELYINEDYIENIEATSKSDTCVRIHNGTNYVVAETPEQIIAKIVEWRQKLNR